MDNIAILHYTCPPVVGGVEEIVRQQASLFHRYYHPVKIIAGDGSQFTEDYEVEINPIFSSHDDVILKLQRDPVVNQAQILQLAEKIVAYLKKSLQNFNILIAHNVLSMPYNLPLTMALHKLADLQTIKVINWNHDSPYFYKRYPDELKKEPWLILKKHNPNIHYVTISTSRVKEFRELYQVEDELVVIPNGIDPICFFRMDMTTVRLIQEQDLFSTDLILVHPSRLHPRKNIELSIRVLRALHDLGSNAKLLLTGAYDPHGKKKSGYYNSLKNLAKDLKVNEHLIIVAEHHSESGEKLSADRIIMRDLYQISDLLFLPSKHEGFGIPLLEAGMIKLPIACSDIVPFQSIAGSDVLYFSLDDSPDEIARKILEFLHHLAPHRMYKNVIRDYVWDNIYKKMIKPYLASL